jgi:hypothetical protein
METGKIIQAFMAKGPLPGREQAESLAPVLNEATQAVLAELDRLGAAERHGTPVPAAERLHVLTLLMACAEYARVLAAEGRPVLPDGLLARLSEALEAPAPPPVGGATVLPLAAAGRALRAHPIEPATPPSVRGEGPASTPVVAAAPAPACDDDQLLADLLDQALRQIPHLMR